MDHLPERIGGAEVLLCTKLDDRHERTGATKHFGDVTEMPPASGLAICRYEDEDGYYLFGCDEDWNSVSDTWHESLEEAKGQAEFEYKGVSKTWRPPT